MTQIMHQCGILRIPYEKVIASEYAKKLGWTEPNGFVQHKDGWYGQKGKGEKLVPGKDTADIGLKEMRALLDCKESTGEGE
jgi:hypothetical protein